MLISENNCLKPVLSHIKENPINTTFNVIVTAIALAAVIGGGLALFASLTGVSIGDLASLGWKIGAGITAGGVGILLASGLGNAIYFKFCRKQDIVEEPKESISPVEIEGAPLIPTLTDKGEREIVKPKPVFREDKENTNFDLETFLFSSDPSPVILQQAFDWINGNDEIKEWIAQESSNLTVKWSQVSLEEVKEWRLIIAEKRVEKDPELLGTDDPTNAWYQVLAENRSVKEEESTETKDPAKLSIDQLILKTNLKTPPVSNIKQDLLTRKILEVTLIFREIRK